MRTSAIDWEDEDETYFSVTEDVDHFTWYMEEGLDAESEEACVLAAEARSHAKGKGHGGFVGQRHFEVSGSLSLQEKRARQPLVGRQRMPKRSWQGQALWVFIDGFNVGKFTSRARKERAALRSGLLCST